MTRSASTTANTLGWAAFLACSWTWCIGMFLPVLLVRDFGFMGWLVFAAPNIIGAAAMGWVLWRPGASQRIVEQHAVACQCFSAVTIAFHCFFVAWLVRAMLGVAGPILAAAMTVGFFLLLRKRKAELALAAGVLVLSLICFVAALAMRGVPVQVFEPALRQGHQLSFLSPVIVFGFALCPYLDLTFLRARAMTAPKAGIAAFTIGFGCFFLLMILFTLCYSRWLLPELVDRLPQMLVWVIGIHIVVQTALTVALHATPLLAADAYRPVTIAAAVAALLMLGLPMLAAAPGGLSPLRGMSPLAAVRGEMVYRLFLGFYGLVFPAYVWICMIPYRMPNARPTQHRRAAFVVAVIVAAPAFYLGFIAGRMIWLLPGLAVVLLARLIPLIYRRSSSRSSTVHC
jgi:hypothetical protein